MVRTAKTVGSTVALMVNILSTKNRCIDLFNAMARDLDSLDGLDCMRHLVSGRPRAAKARLRVSQLGTKGLVSYHREEERDVMEKLLSDYIYIYRVS